MKNYIQKFNRSAFVAVAAAFVSLSSNAFVVDSSTAIGTNYTISYSLLSGATDPNGNLNNVQDLSGTVVFSLTSFTGTTIGFNLNVSNTSALLGNEVGLRDIAFGTDPDATSVSLTQILGAGESNKFLTATTSVNPALVNAVLKFDLDVQASTGTGYQNTLNEGQFDSFSVLIGFGSTANGVSFSPFSSKFQTSPGSFEFPGGGGGGGGGGGSAPEPGTLALVGLGLLGAVWSRKRQEN